MDESPEELKALCAARKAERLAEKGHLTKTGNAKGRPVGGNLLQKLINEAGPLDINRAYSALIEAATDPDHRNFAYANKALMDRLAHLSHYEKEKNAEARNGITINISGLGKAEVIEDGEFKDV